MKNQKERFKAVEKNINADNITVMIVGLGSVGTYLLDYLVSMNDPSVRIVAVGRNYEKMEKKVNIVKISALIRQAGKSHIMIESNVDLEDTASIQKVIEKYEPDFIVNSSRAYPGLKYGSISWSNVRAYGIWSPLAVRFVLNIMDACEAAGSNAVVINTSYSDAVIPWIKSCGKAYPDFGSGNLNHLIPRIKYAAADMLEIHDFWNIDVMFAAGHFHDVCISKEGHTEGVSLPLKIYYKGEERQLNNDAVFQACRIPMPVSEQRNMMNASSNYQIIKAVIDAVRIKKNQKVFSAGAFGNLGGYPVQIGYLDGDLCTWMDESAFSFVEMREANRKSMYLDGVEDVKDGKLYYTDELIQKARDVFHICLPKTVDFHEVETVCKFIIDQIIVPWQPGGYQNAKKI